MRVFVLLCLVAVTNSAVFNVVFNNDNHARIERNKQIARTFIACFDFPNLDLDCWRNIFNPNDFLWETLPATSLPEGVPHTTDSAEGYIEVLEGFATVLPDLTTQEEANIRVASETTVVIYGNFAGNTPEPSIPIAPRHTWVLEIDGNGLITKIQEIADQLPLTRLAEWLSENPQHKWMKRL